MEIINKTENQVTFSAETGESLANAVRRYLGQVLVLAIDEVEISKNDSALYDETVAHRLGLVALKNGSAVKENTEKLLKLKVKKDGMVYSGELLGDIKPVYDNVPITLLSKNQELDIAATVKAGKGNTHAKFSPGLMYYRNLVDITIGNDCPKEVVEKCPVQILKDEGGKIVVTEKDKCDMCEACVEVCQKQGKDSIHIAARDELVITVESFGQLSPAEMVGKSVEVLKKDLGELSKKLK